MTATEPTETGFRDDWGKYRGEGIWSPCEDCGALHEVEEQPAFRTLLERLCTEIGDSTKAAWVEFGDAIENGTWRFFGPEGRIEFHGQDGRVASSAFGVVASWNDEDHSWKWGWDFPDDWMPAAMRLPAETLRDIGAEEGWDAVTRRLLNVNAHEAWHLTKLTAHAMGWPIVYRMKVNPQNWHYYVFSQPAWADVSERKGAA